MQFDEQYWTHAVSQPDWYLKINDFLVEAKTKYEPESPQLNKVLKTVRHFFEQALIDNKVTPAKPG